MSVTLLATAAAGTTTISLELDMDDNDDPEVVPAISDIDIIVVPCAITADTIPAFGPV
jgi:hypothetical protein